MIATIVNAIGIIISGSVGTLFRSRVSEKLVNSLLAAMGLVVITIGIQGVVGSSDTLCIVVCLAIGTLIGELLHIDKFIDGIGSKVNDKIKNTRFADGKFSEGFVTASVLFTVGAMAIMGSIEAGINHNYSIILTKTVIDIVSALALSAAMGFGVTFAFIPVFIWQGLITILASVIAPVLGPDVIAEMSGVGGALFVGMGLNMIGITDRKVNVSNMLPSIVLPVVYVPLSAWLGGLF